MPLTRLAVTDDGDVLGLAGPGADRFTAGGADVADGPDSTVIVANAGDDLDASGVRNRDTFTLVGPVPGDVADRLLSNWGVTPWSRTRWESHPVHLFVRIPEGLLYLGTGRYARAHSNRDQRTLEDCHLAIDPPLDFDVLDRVRPPSTPTALPGLEWLDHLDGDRAAALQMFTEGWHPAPFSKPEPSTVTDVPTTLAEFYRLAHGRPHVLGVQNSIRPPGELRTDHEGLLKFGLESQGGFVWALDTSEDDPVVWTIEDPTCRHRERERLSGFLIQFSLYEAVMSSSYRAWTDWVPWPVAHRLTGTLRRVPLRTWMWPLFQTSFYVAPGLIIETTDDPEDEQCQISAGAAHHSVLRPFADLDIPWTRFDG
ncbi:hypothetical protein AB0L25_18545 [Spirillospora sp. NPDC052242]